MSESTIVRYTVNYSINRNIKIETVTLWAYEDPTESTFKHEIAIVNDYHPDDIIILDWKRKK